MGSGIPLSKQHGPPYRVHVLYHYCPGDTLVSTAAIENLHRAYPGRFLTSVYTTCPEVWQGNPRITPLVPGSAVVELRHLDSSRPGHFIDQLTGNLGEALGVPIPVTVRRPVLHLDGGELDRPEDLPDPYILINASWKSDYTAKYAGDDIFREVVGKLGHRVRFVQIGSNAPDMTHTKLDGVIDRIGKTSVRELVRLAYHSVGGIGGVTFLGHICAALGKPYVCYAGGRESPEFIGYDSQLTLSTLGELDCCKSGGCWMSRTVPLGDGSRHDKKLCALPVLTPSGYVPECMRRIGSKPAIEWLRPKLPRKRKTPR